MLGTAGVGLLVLTFYFGAEDDMDVSDVLFTPILAAIVFAIIVFVWFLASFLVLGLVAYSEVRTISGIVGLFTLVGFLGWGWRRWRDNFTRK
jgi:hypothetical protein